MADSARISLASEPLALGALDGRYRAAVAPLVDHLSEAALNRDRVHVEVEWLLHLTDNSVLPGTAPLTEAQRSALRKIVTDFNAASVAELAEIEAITVHDVKAVEYYIGRRLEGIGIANLTALVHFGCTSEDINNLSYALGIKDAVMNVWLPAARALVAQITAMAEESREVPMLSRTHGQPATPTTLGKELAVLAWRLTRQLDRIEKTEFLGKINGATGTYAAHYASVPSAQWQDVSRSFVEGLGLSWNPLTTQIESHDWQAELYADMARFNRILHNLCTDVWSYISIGYFAQIPVEGATGSSTMPHKVNPIRFENAEANLEISNGLLDTLGSTLVTSRWQRDLTDSSSQRNIGTAFGHSLLAISNVAKGLDRLDVAEAVLANDLDHNWEVLGEAIQMVMRAEAIAGVDGMENPYERLKDLTRGQRVDSARMQEFVSSLGLSSEAEARLLALTPGSYTGIASTLVDHLKK
ncbi:MAG: adenylosuccinate lyase [Paeniglutamicibacter terrestris]|uniref:Adenylosuccinate lyase n=1 Tax=Paeniglutamicibacter terrestris TaxID=2723403 RepID=A0ABX1G0V1_9MICC|nr:adenylosuccinate lyase [Paeniglutamicibacter terrestris]ASN40867.1 adenylosuccinate lyase [Arthrobacter sp. 7749]NKG19669.1 adenylosuccinate lyase [Paeniglutamicibacter terrestris]